MASVTATPAAVAATPAPAAVVAAVVAVASKVLALAGNVVTLARYHTRGAVASVSYRLAGVAGIVWCPLHAFVGGIAPQTLLFTLHPAGTPAPAGSTTLACKRAAAGGKQGRVTFTAPSGAWFTICNTLLGFGPNVVVGTATVPPLALQGMCLHVNVALAPAKATTPAKATSAIVAAANVQQAAVTGTVATPATVAATAAPVAASVVARLVKHGTGKPPAART